jgi:hypothetical protein
MGLISAEHHHPAVVMMGVRESHHRTLPGSWEEDGEELAYLCWVPGQGASRLTDR